VVRLALFLGLAAHIAIAIWNGFFGPSFGAEGDALNFHNEAIYYANNLGNFEYTTGWVYSYFLGIMYRIFTDHIFFGSMISVISWFISAFILIATMRFLDQTDSRIALALLAYSLWPSALLNNSVTLRESFETLGVSCIIYASLLCFWHYKNKWVLLIFGMIVCSVLHGALLVFSAASLIWLLYNIGVYRFKFSLTTNIMFMSIVGAFVILAGYFTFGNIAYNLDSGFIGAVENFNEGAISINARADYRADFEFGGILNIILFFPTAFLQYMVEPIPGRIENIQDASLFLENFARIFLLIMAFVVNRKIPSANRAPHSFILVAYVGLSVIWSVGTVNWGTASRHHAPGLMLVIVAAMFQIRARSISKAKFPRADRALEGIAWKAR
jgi:hypothetical protein